MKWLVLGAAALLLATRRTTGALAYGARVVEVAARNLGIKEVPPGSNRAPEIDAWLRAVGQAPGQAWCAAFVTFCLAQAGRELGVTPPIAGSAAAKTIMAQFKAAGRWVEGAAVRKARVPAGSVAVWDRSKDGSGFEGHTGIVAEDRGDTLVTIEGNTPWEAVARLTRAKGDPRLLGVGLVGALAVVPKPPSKPPAPAPAPQKPPPPPEPEPPRSDGGGLDVVIGDSLGFGLAAPLAHVLGRPTWNGAENSTTIAQWGAAGAQRVTRAIAGQRPVVVWVSLGTNDIAGHVAAGTLLREDVRAIVAAARGSGARVAWILPPSLPWPGTDLRVMLAQELDAARVPAFESAAAVFGRAPDGVHATPKGYQEWAAQIAAWAAVNGV